MCQPCFYVILFEKVQIRPHHMYLGILLLFIAQNAVLVSTIIMIREFVAARFMEIFRPTIGWLLRWLWRLLFLPPREQARI